MSTLNDLNGTYSIDAAHTHVGFTVRHAMISNTRGRFPDVSGEAVLDGSNPAASSVRVSIDVASIDTRNSDRDGHLRSAEFFDAETHPKITFISKTVQLIDPHHVNVTGDLTVRGVTREVVLPMEFTGEAVDPFGNARIGFEGEIKVNRKDFGLTWNAALETGGILVGEQVKLTLEVEAVKNS